MSLRSTNVAMAKFIVKNVLIPLFYVFIYTMYRTAMRAYLMLISVELYIASAGRSAAIKWLMAL